MVGTGAGVALRGWEGGGGRKERALGDREVSGESFFLALWEESVVFFEDVGVAFSMGGRDAFDEEAGGAALGETVLGTSLRGYSMRSFLLEVAGGAALEDLALEELPLGLFPCDAVEGPARKDFARGGYPFGFLPLDGADAVGFFLVDTERALFFFAVEEDASFFFLFFFRGVREVVAFQRHCAGAENASERGAESDGGAVRASACSSTGRRAEGMASKLARPREDIFACAKCGSVPRVPV